MTDVKKEEKGGKIKRRNSRGNNVRQRENSWKLSLIMLQYLVQFGFKFGYSRRENKADKTGSMNSTVGKCSAAPSLWPCDAKHISSPPCKAHILAHKYRLEAAISVMQRF